MRPLQSHYPYVWLDALVLKVRENHRVIGLALVIAIGVDPLGNRHILGFELGAGESEAFWLDFLRSLRRRGMQLADLVMSDAQEGLKTAIDKVFSGEAWQRCIVHFMRNVLAQIARKDRNQVAAALKLIFPENHHRSFRSTNPLERLNREVRRRNRVGGVFPDRPSVFRLVGSLLLEQDEEWRAGRRYFSKERMDFLLEPDQDVETLTAPLLVEPLIKLEVLDN